MADTLESSNEWFRRSHFPPGGKVGLGWGTEYWQMDATTYEGHQELRALGVVLGRRFRRRELAARLSANLLNDVLAAAGGIEHSLLTLRRACNEAQHYADEHGASVVGTGVEFGLSHDSTVDALYAFANFITWVRGLEERLDRKPGPGYRRLRHQGLVPALRPKRLSKRVQKLVDDLRVGPVGEVRYLANFTLHTALIVNPQSGLFVDANGKLRLPIPDQVSTPVYHRDLLTWNDGRDGIELAEKLWFEIRSFVDCLLEAFEKGIPKRLRKAP
jgi:hypothetical protein